MSRKMSPEREREYEELHAFLDFISTHVSGIDPADPIHPTNVSKRIVAEFGKSKALEGLKQAVNDTVEGLGDKPANFIRAWTPLFERAGSLRFLRCGVAMAARIGASLSAGTSELKPSTT